MFSHEALFVNVSLLVALVLFIWDRPANGTWTRLAAVLFLNALTSCYAVWRCAYTLPEFGSSFASLWPWVFVTFEMAILVYEAWALFVLVRLTDHSPQADLYQRDLRREPTLPTVDVFIPSYNEKREVLEETIRGALALDYPAGRVRVWLLDDSRRPWLKELCRERQVGYLARPTNEHGKAGNLNYAFPRTDGELILVIDADFILRPDFLYRTIGFLLYQNDIGLVQTPQHFRNPDPIQYNLFGSRAWTEEQHYFMTVVQSARDSHDNAFCVGSGWVVKRSCLDDLGGFPQASICEDLEISYVLRGRGVRTLFLNEALAYGLAPESVGEYVKQRVRWCSGTLQHAYLPTGPFRNRGLTLIDRLFYIEPILYWLTYPFIVMVLLAPIVYWYTGVPALVARGDEGALIMGPRFLAAYVLTYWLSMRKVMPPIAMVHKALPAFHLTAAILKALVKPFGAPFQVTSKGEARDRVVVQWSFLWIFLSLAAALLGGMAMNLTGFHEVVEIGDFTALDVFWSLFCLAVFLLCALVCVELPKQGDSTQSEVERASPLASLKAVVGRIMG